MARDRGAVHAASAIADGVDLLPVRVEDVEHEEDEAGHAKLLRVPQHLQPGRCLLQ